MSILDTIRRAPVIGMLMGGKNMLDRARALQATAKMLLGEKLPRIADMQACHSEMTKHLISMKLQVNEYQKITSALQTAESGAGTQAQILKLKASLQKMDGKYESLGNFRSILSDFIHTGDQLSEKLNALE